MNTEAGFAHCEGSRAVAHWWASECHLVGLRGRGTDKWVDTFLKYKDSYYYM